MTLGQKIRQARLDRGLTQKQLVGDHITRNMLSKIENDSATPSVRTLEYLAAQLGLKPGYFIDGSHYSDGSSPDGLDEMRRAYKEGRYSDCIALLEENTDAGTTDEGYLLHARASLSAARQALEKGDEAGAKEYADMADYYNKEGIYYSAEIDAEMSLILAECALRLDRDEFEPNAREYERAVRDISFARRYTLARTEYLLLSGDVKAARQALDSLEDLPGARDKLTEGMVLLAEDRPREAVASLLEAERLCPKSSPDRGRIYEQLEFGYRRLEDFKKAYEYAAKQLR